MDRKILTFKGYYLYGKEGFLPEVSGIYCVFACTEDRQKNRVNNLKLIYIGQSDDIHRRMMEHKEDGDWDSYLDGYWTICYIYARLKLSELDRVEAAMIYYFKPVVNKIFKKNFPFEDIEIEIDGKNEWVTKNNPFEVKKTEDE